RRGLGRAGGGRAAAVRVARRGAAAAPRAAGHARPVPGGDPAMTAATLLEGPGGWLLPPQGAGIHPAERTAVVADGPVGYEWARADGGDCLPAHSLAETLAKLGRALDRSPTAVGRLVVAGDLVESRRRCRRTERDVAALTLWLAGRGVALVALAGNHDP